VRPAALLLVRHGIVAKPSRQRSSCETVRCGGGFSSVEKADGGDNVKLMLIGRHTRQHPPRVPSYRFGVVEVSAEIGPRRQTLSCG
jgi:hypothetical protein